ncbi:ATP-binding cassette domain-containing protein [Telluribacter sp.]|jgi:ABC-2 type transport system ATP-binding protein|uniref:ATP-binding cassette domain-containing protein n=1 Tax=Telluribacter sp. TaxID=1978767 RepID=UPI002E1602D7|nr:ATP-binding cassette domain-containing protein [Telluribacter sp.]
MRNASVIETHALEYSYSKEAKALADINLKVNQGHIYGFLGPNGSGKTTTLRLLLGLLKPQRGRIEVFGQELQTNRQNILKRIGSLIEAPSLYGHLTARENLEVYRPLYGTSRERLEEVLKLVGLAQTGRKTFKQFSLGMKQRLAVALALMPRPDLLILDEPTNGLDPSGIIELRELIRQLNREEGLTILVSSHILSEVEKMVTHLGIIFQGKMQFQGPIQELYKVQQHSSRLLVHTSDNEAAFRALYHYRPMRMGDTLSIAIKDLRETAEIGRMLFQQDLDVYLLQPKVHDLEQLFIDLTTTPTLTPSHA